MPMSSKSTQPKAQRGRQPATQRTKSLDRRALISELTLVALKLDTIRATATTVQVALEGQLADSDDDFARCLQANVANQLSAAGDTVADLIKQLGGTLP